MSIFYSYYFLNINFRILLKMWWQIIELTTNNMINHTSSKSKDLPMSYFNSLLYKAPRRTLYFLFSRPHQWLRSSSGVQVNIRIRDRGLLFTTWWSTSSTWTWTMSSTITPKHNKSVNSTRTVYSTYSTYNHQQSIYLIANPTATVPED